MAILVSNLETNDLSKQIRFSSLANICILVFFANLYFYLFSVLYFVHPLHSRFSSLSNISDLEPHDLSPLLQKEVVAQNKKICLDLFRDTIERWKPTWCWRETLQSLAERWRWRKSNLGICFIDIWMGFRWSGEMAGRWVKECLNGAVQGKIQKSCRNVLIIVL